MAENESLREMAERTPELAIRFDERKLYDLEGRLDAARSELLEAQEAARADMAEISGADSLYSMYHSKDTNLADFIAKAEEKPDAYWRFKANGERPDILLKSTESIHIQQRHPGFNLWSEIPTTIDLGREIKSSKKSHVTGSEVWIYSRALDENVQHIAVVSPVRSGKHGNHLRVITSFKTTQKGLENFLKKESVSTQGPGGSPGYPSPRSKDYWRDALPEARYAEETILSQEAGVNSQILGATTFRKNTLPVIRLFAGHDASTVRHELAHVIRRNLEASASRGNRAAAKRYARLEQEFGITDGKWTLEQEEAFAKSFERYLYEGVAPTAELAEAFETIKAGMADVYASADAAGVDISPEVRNLFNSMFTMPFVEGRWQFNRALAKWASGKWAEFDSGEISLNQTRQRNYTSEQIERINKSANSALERQVVELQMEVHAMLNDPDSPISKEIREDVAAP